jgi:hypothetical protein
MGGIACMYEYVHYSTMDDGGTKICKEDHTYFAAILVHTRTARRKTMRKGRELSLALYYL